MPLCLLSIHVDDVVHDVVLPASQPVAGLLPDVVALAGRSASDEPLAWRLLRMSGDPLDGGMTLVQSGVRDGDALLLVGDVPTFPVHRPWDAARVVAAVTTPQVRHEGIPSVAVVAALMVLSWAGRTADPHWTHTAAAAAIAVGASCRSVIGRDAATRLAAVLGWGATGFLAAADGVVSGSLVVGTAASGTAAALLIRWTGVSAALVGALSLSIPAMVGAAVATAWPGSVAVAGTVSAVVAVAALGMAGRLAVLTAGPEATDGMRGHAVLDGIVVGSAAGAAAGVAVASLAAPDARTLALAAVFAVVLVLRARVYVDPMRSIGSTVCGIACAAIGLAITATTFPQLTPWAAVAVASIALAAPLAREPGPVAGRCVDAIEYAAIAAVIPIACWVGGLYAAARGWHLS